eukprot:m.18631 g.18631  ORF g.18631 m.18631 type:complete len:421 (+) comp27695_c0_seq4:3055-4317(+)
MRQTTPDAKYCSFTATPQEATRQVSTEEMRIHHPIAGLTCMEAERSRVEPYVPTVYQDMASTGTMASTGADPCYRPSLGVCPPYDGYPWNPTFSIQQYPNIHPDYPSYSASNQHVTQWMPEVHQPSLYGQHAVSPMNVCPAKRKCDGVKLPQRRGATQLWEFLLDLLNEKGNEKVIAWIDEETFTFRVIDPDELARRWGELKARPKMNYDKLSRSLRYYYQKKFLTKIASEKYVYRLLCHPSVLYASLGGPPRDQRDRKRRAPSKEVEISDSDSDEGTPSPPQKRGRCPLDRSPYSYCSTASSPMTESQLPLSKALTVVQAPLSTTFLLPSDLDLPKHPAIAIGNPATPLDSDSPAPSSPVSEQSDTAQTLSEFLYAVMSSDDLLSDEEIDKALPGNNKHASAAAIACNCPESFSVIESL